MRKLIPAKLFSAAVTACLLTAGLPAAAFADSDIESVISTVEDAVSEPPFAEGSGEESDPWLIDSVESLLAFAESVNDGSQYGYAQQYLLLTEDLDLTGISWTPIGSLADMESYSTMFLGTFDGGGHTISGLEYSTDEFVCGAGLFGINCGIIQNLNVENVTVTCNEANSLAIGGVIGYNMYGTVSEVSVTNASVTGNNCTGVLIGGSQYGEIYDCSVSDSSVTVIGDNDFSDGPIVQADIAECGGLIIGGSFGGVIDNCSASGTITATGSEPVGLGGIGGCLEMMDTISNCTADVIIESEGGGHAIGGLCGYAGTHSDPDVCMEEFGATVTNYPSVIDNCSVTVGINAPGATHVGGLIGTGLYYFGEETAFAVTNCSVSGSIDGAVTPGAIAGRAEGSSIEDCTFDLLIDGNAADDTQVIGTTDRMYESADQYEEESAAEE